MPAAAGAQLGRRGKRDVEFTPAAADFALGSVKIGSASAPSDRLSSVTLVVAEGGPMARVADAVAALGGWRRDVAGTVPYTAWQISFSAKFR